MNEREREELALFRYGAISDFISGSLARGEQKRLMALKAARQWRCPSGQPVTVSVWQLKAWLKEYRRGGVDGLRPKRRKDSGQVRALSEPLRKVFSDLRLAHPDWGVPELMRQARQSGLISDDEAVSLSTLYRLIGRAQAPMA
jgi:hypothetical protein